jgi:hypothetical protein
VKELIIATHRKIVKSLDSIQDVVKRRMDVLSEIVFNFGLTRELTASTARRAIFMQILGRAVNLILPAQGTPRRILRRILVGNRQNF